MGVTLNDPGRGQIGDSVLSSAVPCVSTNYSAQWKEVLFLVSSLLEASLNLPPSQVHSMIPS